MIADLKRLRAAAGLTQSKLASLVGVTQPTYQRWESGLVDIPREKVSALANVLGVNKDIFASKRIPNKISLYDDSASEDLSYYGEAAIHFSGGGDPLLLSISEGSFSRFHRDLQKDIEFFTIESLSNQTVIVRRKAISDVTFSSEAYDTYGPEHDQYKGTRFMHADVIDWNIIEWLAHDGNGDEDFEPADVSRVRELIMITDEQYANFIKKGTLKPEELENERKKNNVETDRVFSLATETVYQFSNGKRRAVCNFESEELFEAFYPLVDYPQSYADGAILRYAVEGRHYTIFINTESLD